MAETDQNSFYLLQRELLSCSTSLTYLILSLEGLETSVAFNMHRRPSNSSESPILPYPSPPLPTQTHHPSIIVPTLALVESVAGAAHYSGTNVDPDSIKRRRGSREKHSSHHENVEREHQRVLDDLHELYCCRPTSEIFDRTWRRDAVFEVG